MEEMESLANSISSNKIILTVIILILSFVLTHSVRKLMTKASERYLNKRIIIKNFIPIINLGIHLASLLYIIFGVLEITADTMLGLGLSAGVAIGFAIQDVLQNIFGGLVIIFSRPFNIGDRISVDQWYGEVTDISLLKVKIQTNDDSLISIPSKTFLQHATSNTNSGALDCQVVTDIHVPASISAAELVRTGREVVWSSPYTWLAKPVTINILDHYEYGKSALIVRIKAYVFDHRFENRYSSDLTSRMQAVLGERGRL